MSAHKKKCTAKPAAAKCPSKAKASCPVDASDRANIHSIRATFNLKSDADAVKLALSYTAGHAKAPAAQHCTAPKNDNHCHAAAQKCTHAAKKCTR